METSNLTANGKAIAQDLKTAGRKAYDRAADTAQAAGSKLENRVMASGENLAETAEAYFETAQKTVSDAMDTTVSYVKSHPVQTAIGAAAIGFLAGIALRRKH